MSNEVTIIDGATMIELLTQIADSDPDFKYPDKRYDEPDWPWHDRDGNCLYAKNKEDGPACIVGHVMDRLGILSYALEGNAASDVLVRVPLSSGFTFSHRARRIADLVQQLQDEGASWSDAVDRTIAKNAYWEEEDPELT